MNTLFADSFVAGSYKYRDRVISSQSSVNLYTERTDPNGSGKFHNVLVPLCGLTRLFQFNAKPVRALYVCNGPNNDQYLWAVVGNSVYRIHPDLQNYTHVGTLGDTDQNKVSIADNGFDIVFADGTTGVLWRADQTADDNSVSITPINLPTYSWGDRVDQVITPTQVQSLNQRFLIDGAQDGFGIVFFSELASTSFVDPYGRTNYFTAESSSDQIVAIKAIPGAGKLWVFGERSYEIWSVSESGYLVFESADGANFGCNSRDSVSVLGTHIYWQGASNVGYNSFYMSDAGHPHPERISTNAIEHELESYDDKYGISCAYSYEGHEFYICSFVGSDKSWCFDRSTGEWHERAERDYSAAVNRRWDVLQTQVFDNRIITGSSKGQVSYIDYENRNQLDGNPIYVERTSPTYCSSDNNVIFRELYLDISQGTTPILVGTHASPLVRLSVSLDGGYTFDDYDWRDMGESGDYVNATKWHNLGISRDITIRIAISSPIKYTINGVRLTIQECRRT